jgi:hypothetical protein
MTSTYIESDKSPWEVSKLTPNLHVIIVTSEEAKRRVLEFLLNCEQIEATSIDDAM